MIRTWFPPSSELRHACALLLAAMLIGSVACNSQPAGETAIAGYLPYGSSGVDTDLIFPRDEGASRFLIRNWPPQRTLTEDAMWVFGDWAHVGFFSVSDEPPTFVAEAMPFAHPDAPQQTLRLVLNGAEITTVEMPPGWRTYEFEMPAEHLLVGWNELELDFAYNLRPADFFPESKDRRTLAARFRRLEMRNGMGRPYSAERTEEVRLVAADGAPAAQPASDDGGAPQSDPATAAIEMPADSFIQVYLAPTETTQVVGELQVTFADPDAGGSIRVVAEAVEPDATTTLWETTLAPSAAARTTMTAELAPWAGQPIGVRIRVFGDVNGVVRWDRLVATTAADDMYVGLDPARLVPPPTSGVLERPDVFVILLDAARADAFDGSRGADLAPNVVGLAAEGTRFAQAWSPSSWTGQTIPSLLTGMTPDAVGVETWESILPPDVIKFPEILYAAGYRTLLWSQHNIYRRSQELRHGFEEFADLDPAQMKNRELLPTNDWLLADDRPTFALVHLLPPHTPYDAPAPFGGSRSAWYDDPYAADVDTLTDFDTLVPKDPELRDRIRRYAIARYEENVQFADHLVGRFIDQLKAAGRYDDALIVVLADHGEAFLEHDRFLHTRYLYEEFVHVPFVIKWPRAFTGFEATVDTPVTLIDLAPTIIDALGIVDDRASYHGRSLLPLILGQPARERAIYAYTSNGTPDGGSRPIYALRWGRWKLIRDQARNETRLYDLAADPSESTDIYGRSPFFGSMMAQVLDLTRARNRQTLMALGGAQAAELDEETRRSLRALGYLR